MFAKTIKYWIIINNISYGAVFSYGQPLILFSFASANGADSKYKVLTKNIMTLPEDIRHLAIYSKP